MSKHCSFRFYTNYNRPFLFPKTLDLFLQKQSKTFYLGLSGTIMRSILSRTEKKNFHKHLGIFFFKLHQKNNSIKNQMGFSKISTIIRKNPFWKHFATETRISFYKLDFIFRFFKKGISQLCTFVLS